MAVIHTRGNSHAHVVLRGGGGQTNYDSVNVALCEKQLLDARVPVNIVVDCSHANSNKNHELQPMVMNDVADQIVNGNRSIIGLMVESHINPGNQSIPENRSQLKYGVSVTDPCVGWDTTVEMVHGLRDKVKDVLPDREMPTGEQPAIAASS